VASVLFVVKEGALFLENFLANQELHGKRSGEYPWNTD
jgi:hypothetical protein